jgi:hypothetical protein
MQLGRNRTDVEVFGDQKGPPILPEIELLIVGLRNLALGPPPDDERLTFGENLDAFGGNSRHVGEVYERLRRLIDVHCRNER